MNNAKPRAIPSSLRRANERTLVGLLMRMGAASRAQMAKVAGISEPTCGKIIDELIESDVVEELIDTETSPRQAGRPGRMVRLDTSKPRFLVIQFDVIETSIALVPVGAPVEDRWELVVPTTDSAQGWLREIRKAASQLATRDLWGVLVSAPGIVNEDAGKILFSPNMHWSENVDLPALLRQVWKAPALLIQENRAAALGHLYADPKNQDFLLADFGQGVGGAIIESGRLFCSTLPLNAEFGHTPIDGNHRQCGCGATGCLETRLSRAGLLRSFVEANRGQPEEWSAMLAHIRSHGIQPWLEESLDAAANIIAGSLNVLGLQRLVVTGSLGEMPPQVMKHLAAAVEKGALWGRFGKVSCESAPHRRIAGLVAAGIDRLLVPVHGERQLS